MILLIAGQISFDIVRVSVATAFTVTSAVGAVYTFIGLRETIKDRAAYREAGLNGLGHEVSDALVRVETVRFINMLLFLLAGLGATVGGNLRNLPWLLAVIPIVSVYASVRDARSRKRQVELAKHLMSGPATGHSLPEHTGDQE